jgi:fluoride exporter
MKWLMIFLGGGAGSLLRAALSFWMLPVARVYPWATLCANVAAALMLGAIFGLRRGADGGLLWSLLAVGFCGGLSTFSTFSLETAQLLRHGHYAIAALNIGLSVAVSTGLVWWLAFHWRG